MSTPTVSASRFDWQVRITARTGEPAVPVVNRSLHRVFWVPKRYVGIVAVVMDGKRFTMRPLADRTGYSLKGAQQALWSLHEMAIGTLITARGCHGYSRFIFNRDCNVSTNATSLRSLDRERTLVETFNGDGLFAWPAGRVSGPSSGAGVAVG